MRPGRLDPKARRKAILFALRFEVLLDLLDGVELSRGEVGVGDGDAELVLEAGDEVGEGEGVEKAGGEEALVRARG